MGKINKMKRSVFRVALITLFCILPSLFANTDPEEFALEPLVNSSNKVPAPRTIVNQVMEIEMFSNGLSLGRAQRHAVVDNG